LLLSTITLAQQSLNSLKNFLKNHKEHGSSHFLSNHQTSKLKRKDHYPIEVLRVILNTKE
jgi:hypothetical protein